MIEAVVNDFCVMHVLGDTELAAELRDIYGDVNAVEFFVGLLTEKGGTTLPSVAPPLTLVGVSMSEA